MYTVYDKIIIIFNCNIVWHAQFLILSYPSLTNNITLTVQYKIISILL